MSSDKFLHRLVLPSVRLSDAGEYTAVAGASMSQGHLTVEGRDVKIAEPADRNVVVSSCNPNPHWNSLISTLKYILHRPQPYRNVPDISRELVFRPGLQPAGPGLATLRDIVLLLQVVEKQRATFEFEVNEDDVEGHWMRNGVEIHFQSEKRFSYTNIKRLHRLTITESYRSDAGEYTFLAGRNRSTMNLHIRCTSPASSLVFLHNP